MMLAHSNWRLCWNDFIQIEWKQFLSSCPITSISHEIPCVAMATHEFTPSLCIDTIPAVMFHMYVYLYEDSISHTSQSTVRDKITCHVGLSRIAHGNM